MAEKKLPRGIRNNNPLNIKKGNNWQGERKIQTDPIFEQFESMQYGLRAGFKLLRNYITGFNGKRKPCRTLHDIIFRWAPTSENHSMNYLTFVAAKAGLNPYEEIRFEDRKKMIAIVEAMVRFENGMPIDVQLIESAYDLLQGNV